MASTAAATPAAVAAPAPKVKKAAPTKKANKTAGKKGGKVRARKTKRETKKFLIDCSVPVRDDFVDASAFEKFLVDRIKVDGKTSNLGSAVSVSRDDAQITVTAKAPFSKRYLKYLTKKFLKKSQLKDYMHVVANSKGSYEVRYYKTNAGEEAEENDE